jgi:hypothetical protein
MQIQLLISVSIYFSSITINTTNTQKNFQLNSTQPISQSKFLLARIIPDPDDKTPPKNSQAHLKT